MAAFDGAIGRQDNHVASLPSRHEAGFAFGARLRNVYRNDAANASTLHDPSPVALSKFDGVGSLG